MELARRDLLKAAGGLAGLAALGPVARLLPESTRKVGMVVLGPARIVEGPQIFEVCEEVPRSGGFRYTYRAVWKLERFTGGFEPCEVTPCFFESEFTEEERPGTGGGIVATVPQTYEDYPGYPRRGCDWSWVIDMDLAEFGNRIPDKPLWIRAQGVMEVPVQCG